MTLGTAIVIALAIALPWHVLATLRNPPSLRFLRQVRAGKYHGFFWFHFFTNTCCVGYIHQHRGPGRKALMALWRRSGKRAQPGRFCGCWAICWRLTALIMKRRSRPAPRSCLAQVTSALAWIIIWKSFSLDDIGPLGEPMGSEIQRIGEVPIYQADPIVRRAESLQRTRDAAAPVAWMPEVARWAGLAYKPETTSG